MTIDRCRGTRPALPTGIGCDRARRRALRNTASKRCEHSPKCARITSPDERRDLDFDDLFEIAREPATRLLLIGVEQIGPPADDDAFHESRNSQPIVPPGLGIAKAYTLRF